MFFESILQQEGPLSILKKALCSGRVPTAYLFTGPGGCGRMMAALATAASLNCESGPQACGKCSSCRLYLAGNHPDLHVIKPESGNKPIVIKQIREQILERAYLKPLTGRTSTFIVDDAHLMNSSAASAFLKTLEEPTPTSYFILIASDRESLLPTIASRCQTLSFKPLSRKVLEDLLVRGGVDRTEAALLSSMARGSMEKALDYHLSGALEGMAGEFEPLVSLADKVAGQVLDISHRWGKNRQDALKILEFMAQWYRDMMILAEGGSEKHVINAAHLSSLREAAAKTTAGRLTGVLESVEDAREALESNTNVQLTLDSLLLTVRDQLAS
jgi:DNA polymerase-3 subunit delta'